MKSETIIIHPEGDWYEALRGTVAVDCEDPPRLIKGELGRIDSGFTIRIVDEVPRPELAPMFVKARANAWPYLKKKKGRS